MSMLFAAQTDIMTLSAGDLKEALKHFDKAPDVSRVGMFTNHPDDIGASMQVLEDITTMVEFCAAYGMGHITIEQKFHLFISSAFAKELRKLCQASYRAATASTSGTGQGSKIYVAFLNCNCSRGAHRWSVTHLVAPTRRSSRAQNHDTPGRRRGDGAHHGGSMLL